MLSVMVVDDDELLRRVLVRGLAGVSRVRAVGASEDALAALARGERYDMILFDLSVGPAVEFVERVRATARGQADRVVLHTGADAVGTDARASVENRVLQKPSMISDIEAMARSLRARFGEPA